MSDLLAQILVVLTVLIGGGGALYLKGRKSANTKNETKSTQSRAEAAERKVEEVRVVGKTVSETRNDIAVTPGSDSGKTAKEVRDALLNDKKSLQGRLGAMARDKENL